MSEKDMNKDEIQKEDDKEITVETSEVEPVDDVEESEVNNDVLVTEEEESFVKGDDIIDVEKPKKHKKSFMATLQAVVVDELIIGASAYVLLLVFDLIIRFALGYYVSNMVSMYLILFIIVSVVYPLIMECSKFGSTIGRKISGFETEEVQDIAEENND